MPTCLRLLEEQVEVLSRHGVCGPDLSSVVDLDFSHIGRLACVIFTLRPCGAEGMERGICEEWNMDESVRWSGREAKFHEGIGSK